MTADPAGMRAIAIAIVRRADGALLVTSATEPGTGRTLVRPPGGGIDPGESVVDAALREAEEETGLNPAGVDVLGVMPELALPRGNFLVTPVLAWWAAQSPVRVVDYGESAQVFRVPVRDLLDPDNRVMATVSRAGQTFQSPAFTVNGVVVWGFTGMILNQLFEQLGWAVPWDRARLYGIDV